MQQICERLQVPVEDGLGRLRNQGIDAEPGDNMREVAQRHGKTPIEVVKVIQG